MPAFLRVLSSVAPSRFLSRLTFPLLSSHQADIEGFEYDLFDELLTVDEVELPEQISLELHYKVIDKELTWMPRQKTAGEIALLGTRLYEQGYRVLSREDNEYVLGMEVGFGLRGGRLSVRWIV